MPIDFRAIGFLERFSRRTSPGSYKHVTDGTLKELMGYVCARNRSTIELYRITIGVEWGSNQMGTFVLCETLRRHEHLFVALAFPTRSVSSAVSVAFRPDSDNDDGISLYNEALEARSNCPSRV